MRRVPLREEPLSRVRLRTGREMSVVDVSNTGVLVEGHVRLLPGTHIDVHVVTRAGRQLVRSRVARCFVAALQPDAVWYRGALAFDRHVDTAPNGYAFPDASSPGLAAEGHDYPPPTAQGPSPHAEGPSAQGLGRSA
jgi:hypothetical protein